MTLVLKPGPLEVVGTAHRESVQQKVGKRPVILRTGSATGRPGGSDDDSRPLVSNSFTAFVSAGTFDRNSLTTAMSDVSLQTEQDEQNPSCIGSFPPAHPSARSNYVTFNKDSNLPLLPRPRAPRPHHSTTTTTSSPESHCCGTLTTEINARIFCHLFGWQDAKVVPVSPRNCYVPIVPGLRKLRLFFDEFETTRFLFFTGTLHSVSLRAYLSTSMRLLLAARMQTP